MHCWVCKLSTVEECHTVHSKDKLLTLAEHGKVGLANDKGEEEVDADSDGLAGASGLNVVEHRGHQPAQGAPRPSKPCREQALKCQDGTG